MGGGRIKKRGEERTKKRGRDEKGLEVDREREEMCGERVREKILITYPMICL